MLPAEFEQGNALPSCSSFHIINSGVFFCDLLSDAFLHFVSFLLVILFFTTAPSIVWKCRLMFLSTRKLWCALQRKYQLLDEFYSGTSYSSIGWEFNINESTIQYGGTPKKQIFKNCVFILTCLNLSHLQSTLHLVQCTYWNIFFHCSKQVLNSFILMPFSASAIFWFTSSTLAKWFPLRTFFYPRKQNKRHFGWDWRNREGGARGSCCFWSKTAEHSVWCEQVCSWIAHCEMGKYVERVLKKFFLKPNTASHNNTS